MHQSVSQQIIDAHRRRLAILEEQYAIKGINTAPEVIDEIRHIRAELARLLVFDLVLQEAQPTPFPGLILLIGTGQIGQHPLDQSALDAIEYHRGTLRCCWLIGSAGERGSLPVAQQIHEWCRQRRITAFVHAVADPTSVQASYDLVDALYRTEVPQMGLQEDDVIADITGATKPMSIGMVLACGARRPIQYMVRQAQGPSLPIRLNYALRGAPPA